MVVPKGIAAGHIESLAPSLRAEED